MEIEVKLRQFYRSIRSQNEQLVGQLPPFGFKVDILQEVLNLMSAVMRESSTDCPFYNRTEQHWNLAGNGVIAIELS